MGDVPVREIKLDRLMTSELDTDAAQRAKVAGIADIARPLSLDMAAKGVERPELIEQLARAGFVRVQGRAIAPPMDAATFEAYLRKPVATPA